VVASSLLQEVFREPTLLLLNESVSSDIKKLSTGGPPYLRVIHSKTYRSYVKLRIIQNAIC